MPGPTPSPTLTVHQPAWEGELGRQPVAGGQDAGLELARVALHLVAVLVDAAKVVSTAVDIQHDALALVRVEPLAGVVVFAHLNPFGPERRVVAPPLPPRLAADGGDAGGAQLRANALGGVLQVGRGHGDVVDVDPVRHRHPLRREGLQLVDGVERGIAQEAADQLEPLVVRQVCCWLLPQRGAVEVVRNPRLDDSGRDGSAHREGVDRHGRR